MIKVSIIIPVYNVEQYILKCIQSCLEQDICSSEYEIIVVNDGSTDQSLDIISELVSENLNIRVYSQSNKGLSCARNFGVQKSVGEYIWFIDSDDWIEPNCLSKIYELSRGLNLDFLHFQRAKVYDSKLIIPIHTNKYTTDVVSGEFLISKLLVSTPIQLYLIKHSFFIENSLWFTPGLYHEDSMLLPKMTLCAKRCFVVSDVYYFHFQRYSSISNSVKPKNMVDLLCIIELHAVASLKYKDNSLVFRAYQTMISVWIIIYLRNLNQLPLNLRSKYVLKYMRVNVICNKILINSVFLRHRTLGFLLQIVPMRFLYLVIKWIYKEK